MNCTCLKYEYTNKKNGNPKNNPPYPNIKRLYDNGYLIQYDIGFNDLAVRHIENIIDDALDDSNYDTNQKCISR